MKELEILGENRFETYTKTRTGCRGIIVKDGKILVSREEKSDYWLIPGGGLEPQESLEDCCVREALEETGYIVKPLKQFLTLNEYYEEYKYVSHYFVCEVIGTGHQQLTEAEQERGLVPKWIPIEEFLAIVEKHQEYVETNEEKRGAYQREYVALCEYLKGEKQQ